MTAITVRIMDREHGRIWVAVEWPFCAAEIRSYTEGGLTKYLKRLKKECKLNGFSLEVIGKMRQRRKIASDGEANNA